MDAVRKLILERLADLDLNMSEVSLRMGRNHAYLQQFIRRGIPVEMKEKDRAKLAQILDVPEAELKFSGQSVPLQDATHPAPPVHKNPVAFAKQPSLFSGAEQFAAKITPGSSLIGEADLPVFGTAQGGRGALIVTDRAVDWVVRPAPLLRVRDGYGIIVTGDSMHPAHSSGSTALVNPHLPPRNGDTCVFRSHQDDGAVVVIIKELRRFNDENWFVRQYQPRKDFTLKRSEWQVCHVTVGNYFSR